ncbi:putative metalloprotease CJM1_0395 family protein [Oceanisphaera avium]|uniref:Catalase n=1 Tax=Oceanisphaera avium TaxID=1903694 RepID=A0A1Y0CZH7_9GAMM|nr:putative metalloprotease CJM1_0395 family protein [Oceanisphaera avium]ART80732.1 hypothetical protein CBP12_11695 [Oceanisphaera avium]
MMIPSATPTIANLAPTAATTLVAQDKQPPVIAPVTRAQGAQSQPFSQQFSQQPPPTVVYSRQGVLPNETNVVADVEQPIEEKPAAELTNAPSKNMAGKELTLEQQQELLHMQQRDQEVRLHEQQHASVGGQHTGSPSYEFKTGPDGKQYVVEGSVAVDVTPVAGDPSATIEKMRQVKAAALAPAQPSSADKNAAALADSNIAKATAELMQRQEKTDPEAEKENLSAGNKEKANTISTTKEAAVSTPTNSSQVLDKAQVELRNQVIAGVYGQAAQAQSQQLLNLA